jgi:hypothetical protein
MRDEDDQIFVLIWIALFLVGFAISISTHLVSAWPYQLNLSTGILIDMNTSNNETTNFTIYILPQSYNITYYNQTNITYVNLTCVNCTYNNYTYVNYTYNGTNWLVYNQTESNARFLTIAEASSTYSTIANFNSLTTKVDSINDTSIEISETSHTYLWGGIIIAILLGIIGCFLAYKAGAGSGE